MAKRENLKINLRYYGDELNLIKAAAKVAKVTPRQFVKHSITAMAGTVLEKYVSAGQTSAEKLQEKLEGEQLEQEAGELLEGSTEELLHEAEDKVSEEPNSRRAGRDESVPEQGEVSE